MNRLRSPFPGMDPYLESRWSDVHVKLIGFMGEAIQPHLPSDLRARGEERLLLESGSGDDDAGSHTYRTVVAVVEISSATRLLASQEPAVATVDPIIIRRYAASLMDRWVQIIDVSTGNLVVTAINILSPWNKGPGRLNRQYLQKLEDYADAGVSIVEIDLLRFPSRGRLAVTEGDIPTERRSAYVSCIRLGWDSEIWRAYPMPLRWPLPTIPIPLRQTDAQIGLDLQPLIDRVYTAGGHDDIDYGKPLDPPLSETDSRWAEELIKRANR